MNDQTVRETCACGATFEFTGPMASAGLRQSEFHQHKHEARSRGIVLIPNDTLFADDEMFTDLVEQANVVVIRGPKELLQQIEVHLP